MACHRKEKDGKSSKRLRNCLEPGGDGRDRNRWAEAKIRYAVKWLGTGTNRNCIDQRRTGIEKFCHGNALKREVLERRVLAIKGLEQKDMEWL